MKKKQTYFEEDDAAIYITKQTDEPRVGFQKIGHDQY